MTDVFKQLKREFKCHLKRIEEFEGDFPDGS